MTVKQAVIWVGIHQDDDRIDEDELEEVFATMFGREPDDQDREDGLWSTVCQYAELWERQRRRA